VGPVLVGAGVTAVAASLALGVAHLALVVIVPVIYGASWLFGLGILLLVLGFFCLPLGWGGEAPSSVPAGSPTRGVGGVILVGPVPIFFGSWKNVSRRWRVAMAVLGACVLGTVLVVAWLFLR
jgi:uncharacterized membrane protein